MLLNSPIRSVAAWIIVVILSTSWENPVQADMLSANNFSIYGDFRFRLENDWDSVRADGISERDDRLRARVRARIGLKYKASEAISFGMRIRSGSPDSQQSPHITVVDFDDNTTGDADFNFDKWFVKINNGPLWAWAGRNSQPFWKQNELFWDDDVTPLGIAAGYSAKVMENSKLSLNTAYLSMPVGMKATSGNMLVGQAVFSTEFSGETNITAAIGYFSYDSNPSDPDAGTLLDNNGLRDYQTWVANLQVNLKAFSRPFRFGVDYMTNTEDYTTAELPSRPGVTADDTEGYVAFVQSGNLGNVGDWLLAYYYINIEALAFNGSYGQDDWVRWGSLVETRSTDLKGHEFRVARVLAKNLKAVFRVYIVDSIANEENGSRARLDFNFKF